MTENVQLIENNYFFLCPHCQSPVEVSSDQVNCQIFRHGIMKNTYMIKFSSGIIKSNIPITFIQGNNLKIGATVKAKSSIDSSYEEAYILSVNIGQQIPSHASKAFCDDLVSKDLVWGCCKPFKLVSKEGKIMFAIKCDYI